MSTRLHIATLRIDGLPPHMSALRLKQEVERALEDKLATVQCAALPGAGFAADVIFDAGASRAKLVDRIAGAVAAAIAPPASTDVAS